MTLTPTTHASLLFRLRDPQDHDAWVEFVSLYEPVAYRLLRRHGLQDADARDVMQELFMAVSRSIDHWDPAKERGSFRGWLRRVARNLVINGLSPFRADSTMATLRRLIDEPPQALASLNPELPPWFIAIVDRLLEKEPSRRFGSAREVSELLEGCLAHVQQRAGVPLPAALACPESESDSGLRI